MNSVGETIRQKRKELNLTQAQLAELIGCDEYYISSVETGRRKPGTKFFLAIANTLSISTDALYGIESNITLSHEVSELEAKLQKLNPADREMLLIMFNKLIDRLDTDS